MEARAHSPALWHLAAQVPTCTENICRRRKFCPSAREYGEPRKGDPHTFHEPGATRSQGKSMKSGGAREAYAPPIAIMHVLLAVSDSTCRLTIFARRHVRHSEKSFGSFAKYFAACAADDAAIFAEKKRTWMSVSAGDQRAKRRPTPVRSVTPSICAT